MLSQTEKIILTLIVSTLMILLFAVIVIIAILKYRKKQREYIDREKTTETELIKAILEAKEQIIEDISDHLHIEIQQTLSIAKMNLNTVLFSSDKEQQEKLQPIKELLDKGLLEIKSLSRSIDPKMITGHTLEDNITRQLDNVSKKTGILTVFNTSEEEIQLKEQKQIFIYRIVQEAINNILNNANATQICIDLKNELTTFSLTIKDDGDGFVIHPKDKGNYEGIGLRSIDRRIHLMDGEWKIESTPKKGTYIHIKIPYDTEDDTKNRTR